MSEGLVNPGRLAQFTDGLAEVVEEHVADFTPEAVAGCHWHCRRDDSPDWREIFVRRKRPSVMVVWGSLPNNSVVLCQWLINVINIITGNLDRRGGAMFTTPAFDVLGITKAMGGRGQLRVVGVAACVTCLSSMGNCLLQRWLKKS